LRCPAIFHHQLGWIHANDTSPRGAGGQFGQAASVSATDIEDAIALLDAERIHHAQILPPGFASHDESNDSVQTASGIPGVCGDKVGGGACAIVAQGQDNSSPKMKTRLAESGKRLADFEKKMAERCAWMTAPHRPVCQRHSVSLRAATNIVRLRRKFSFKLLTLLNEAVLRFGLGTRIAL
jgi:hypothetical protein